MTENAYETQPIRVMLVDNQPLVLDGYSHHRYAA